MPCPRCPKLALSSRTSSLDLLQSPLQITSLSNSTDSYQSANVLTWVGALLKPPKDATCSTQPKLGNACSPDLSRASLGPMLARLNLYLRRNPRANRQSARRLFTHHSPLITHLCLFQSLAANILKFNVNH